MSRLMSEILHTAFENAEVPDSVICFIKQIIGNRMPVGVMYYGSSLWKRDLTGLLDFYIICDQLSDWNGCSVSTAANYYLPPNIEYYEFSDGKTQLRAKVAVLSLKQLQKATSISSLDTTMWARFCQPVKVLWYRGEKDRLALLNCLIQAAETAVWWATGLGPVKGYAEDYWIALFQSTYRAELRVEANNRPALILEHREAYFKEILMAGWKSLSIPFHQAADNQFIPEISDIQRKQVKKRWEKRERLGRPLNILRLIKAAFTFRGGADYIAWKIKRHRNIDLRLTNFQRKHPILNSPWILFKLYRQGVFNR